MKQPKMSSLTIDRAGTQSLRAKLQKTKTIKIVINVDAGNLSSLSKSPGKRLPPYFQLLGQLLKTKLDDTATSRLDRVEEN
jgi:hypothetical protein